MTALEQAGLDDLVRELTAELRGTVTAPGTRNTTAPGWCGTRCSMRAVLPRWCGARTKTMLQRLSVCCETPMCPSRFVEAVTTSQGSVRVRAGS